jgi:hypothetical protein
MNLLSDHRSVVVVILALTVAGLLLFLARGQVVVVAARVAPRSPGSRSRAEVACNIGGPKPDPVVLGLTASRAIATAFRKARTAEPLSP